MLWRKASKRWKGRGYTLTDIADKIEDRFGKRWKLSRGTIGVLVTTRQEEVPPEVLEFLESLPVLDEEGWQDYLRKSENEPSDEANAAPVAVPEREAAAEGAATSGDKLDPSDAGLDALAGKLDQSDARLAGKLEQSDAKLDTLAGKLDQSDARLAGKLDQSNAKLDGMAADQSRAEKRVARNGRKIDRLTRALWGVGGTVGLGLFTLSALVLVQPRYSPICTCIYVVNGAVVDAAKLMEALKAVPPFFLGAAPDVGEKVPAERYIPNEPLPGQKRTGCNPDVGESTVNGGCWVGTDMAPPCRLLWRHGNKCYRPVAESPEKPVGDEPRPGQGPTREQSSRVQEMPGKER